MKEKNILYIFNGDCAFEAWKKSVGAEGKDFLVWRENYLEGPLPANVSLEAFEKTFTEEGIDVPFPQLDVFLKNK